MRLTHFCALFLLYAQCIFAQQNTLDNSFNMVDNGTSGQGFDGDVRKVLMLKNGNILAVGNFTSYNGLQVQKMVQLKPDGKVDASFALHTINNLIYDAVELSDGSVVVGGSFTKIDDDDDDDDEIINGIAKFSSNGTLDSSFNGKSITGTVYDLELQKDGKILAAGSISKFGSVDVKKILRIDSNGNLDVDFQVSVGVDDVVSKILLQNDGKILVGGKFSNFGAASSPLLLRLNTDGTLDTSFVSKIKKSVPSTNVYALAIVNNETIVAGGNFTEVDGVVTKGIVGLQMDGKRSTTFIVDGGFSSGFVYDLAATATGVMVGGSFSAKYKTIDVNRLLYLDDKGNVDSEFLTETTIKDGAVYSVVKSQDEQWVVGGGFSGVGNVTSQGITKFMSNGEFIPTFITGGTGFNNTVYGVVADNDENYWAVGAFTDYNKSSVGGIVKINNDGMVDAVFSTANIGTNGTVRKMLKLSDNKWLLVGTFTKYNGQTCNRVAVIDNQGNLDTSYLFGVGASASVYDAVLDKNGKIYLVGGFSKFNNVNASKIIRLNADGSVDGTFAPTFGANNTIYSVAIQDDGKLILGGNFTAFNGISVGRLARITTDGALDNSFQIGTGFSGIVYKVLLDKQNRILAGGSFLSFNGKGKPKFLRLLTNGDLDSQFLSDISWDSGTIYQIKNLEDQRIMVMGTVEGTANGVLISKFARMFSDGKHDVSASIKTNLGVFDAITTDLNKLLLVGDFSNINGVAKYRIAKVNLCNNSTTWDGVAWSNNEPDIRKSMVVEGDLVVSTVQNACSCYVAEGKTLTLTNKKTMIVDYELSGKGLLKVEDSSSLIQLNEEAVNSLNATYNRLTLPLFRTDWIFWSSPVKDLSLGSFLPNSNPYYLLFNPVRYAWIAQTASAIMAQGVGYSIRAPLDFSDFTPKVLSATFSGIPNNGRIQVNVEKENQYMLVGNPYMSAIDAEMFMSENEEVLLPELYFWTHATPRNSKGYTTSDYSVYNKFGGVATTSVIPDGLSLDRYKPTGNIATGQGFFVKTSSAISKPVVFSNQMRIRGGDEGNNGLFFKNKNQKAIEKHRFWLNIVSDSGRFDQLLFGYISGATYSIDRGYDSESFDANDLDFYSLNSGKKLSIQAYGLPFLNTDIVPLGYITTDINYTDSNNNVFPDKFAIEFDSSDGLFITQNIYIEDKDLDKIVDIKAGKYYFETKVGEYNSRFFVRFVNPKLDNPDSNLLEQGIMIWTKNSAIHLSSETESIKSISVYNLQGQNVFSKYIEALSAQLETQLSSGLYLSKVELANGKSFVKKIRIAN